jgi:phosphoglycolate phosphatase
MGKIKGVIFDFDGTLTELTVDFQNMRVEVEELAGRYVPEEVLASLKGLFIIEMIYVIEATLGERGPEFRRDAFELLKGLELDASEGKGVYPYTREVLGRLRREGIRVGVVTRSCLDVLRRVFPDMDKYVEAVVTREDIREVKPHPRHIEAMAGLLSIEAEEGIMAGDHPTDIEAGKAAGMETVGVLTGRTTRQEFELAEATYILQDIRGLPDLLHNRS